MVPESDKITPASVSTALPDNEPGEDSLSKSASSMARDKVDDLADLGDYSNVPKLSYMKIFWFFFYNFGIFAWGGPVAQIALIKEKLVIQDKWITVARFQRVFSVYQILPGPEAAELCMYFGCLSAGRIGGIVAGIAFMLPGFILMLVASYVYSLASFENQFVYASFRALQPIVAAMIFRATHKIADHSVRKHGSKRVDPFLVLAALCTAINSALRINIFISLGLYGLIYALIQYRLWIFAGLLFLLQYAAYAIYVVFRGVPSPVSLALGIAETPSLVNLFVLGLVAGTLSFGGAYTAIPFVQVEAVLKGKWLSQNVFIDCIAISNIIPSPLVIFATFVGFQGGLLSGSLGNAFGGAVIITIGMFFPCFLFTIAGHNLLEKLVHNKLLAGFFDGLCGSVIGVIGVIAVQILKAATEGDIYRDHGVLMDNAIAKIAQTGSAAVLYMLALGVLYKFTHKYTVLVLVAGGAISGQFLFVNT
ncbi:hypothetical protein TWF694_004521 [Orbilia ellipsospora]|uniref:Chromate transporter n=1 Tax=Orbilia ellipsospora TaxID=2528407 RepID=A0AAV9WXY4_9PEZI